MVTGRPSDGVRAYLLQRSFLGMFAGLVLLLVLLIAVRRTTQPLVRLTDQVRAVGQDIHAPDADVAGSREIRALAEAFNEMKGRIAGLVQERTFILAGIAHDMRTYLTRLRLRAEFIDDDTQRDKASADMDAMAALLDDSLLFASLDRKEADGGERIDLMALSRRLVDAGQRRAGRGGGRGGGGGARCAGRCRGAGADFQQSGRQRPAPRRACARVAEP
ncbi:MAG: HAMP domain-containing protein [Sphingobium sp.]|nr:HAMP domain-containing protein [Sphingobium sp.]